MWLGSRTRLAGFGLAVSTTQQLLATKSVTFNSSQSLGLCYAVLCYAVLCCVVLCCAMQCCAVRVLDGCMGCIWLGGWIGWGLLGYGFVCRNGLDKVKS